MKAHTFTIITLAAIITVACGQTPTGPAGLASAGGSTNATAAKTDGPKVGTPGTTPSSAPVGLTANGTGQFHADGTEPIVFDWEPQEGAISYRLETQILNENTWVDEARTFDEVRTFTFAFAPCQHRVRIRATYPTGVSAWSNWVVFGAGSCPAPVEAPPPTPTYHHSHHHSGRRE